MQNAIKAVKDYYDGKLQTTKDFEDALEECSKGELVEFIIQHQCRGCFRGVIHD